MRAGADLRVLRAAVFAAACAALAAGGHLLAGGPGIAPWALATGWAAAFAVAAPLAGRERRSALALAAALAAGQLALHSLYTLGQRGHAMADAEAGVLGQARALLCGEHGRTLSVDQATQLVTDAGLTPHDPAGAAAAQAPALAAAHALPSSGAMILGHLLAALAAGWLLRRGEAALWRLIRLSSRWSARGAASLAPLRSALRLLRLLGAGATPSGAPTVRPPRTGHLPRRALRAAALAHAVIRRGPPVSARPGVLLAA
ncbi:hypothetical protein [Streptomyces hoynatensis]|uniref:Integral membrane protein n=1 Tax=Streptomyces hoynatensis TaxID=1141874 RepID=A0A3A9YPT1_9ACTN|nr:hypothetical protein [Streptomyces hoynatensis]RKN38013.1 hypothetical protein D7294_25840 [Streptomyces hoynatensis]